MNKCSSYVLKSILEFIPDEELKVPFNVNKKFREILKIDARYMFQNVHDDWINRMNRHMKYREADDYLDVITRDNGDVVFFLLNLEKDSEKSVHPYFTDFIRNNSELFVDAGNRLEWYLNDGRFHEDLDGDIEMLYYRSIVNPCRVHNLIDIMIFAVKLCYFPYLKISGQRSRDNTKLFVKYEIDGHLMLRDFQKFMLSKHKYIFKGNGEFLTSKFIQMSNDTHVYIPYFEKSISDQILPKDMKNKKQMREELKELIQYRESDNYKHWAFRYILYYKDEISSEWDKEYKLEDFDDKKLE